MGFLQQCAGVFMAEIGRAWHDQELEIRHEHFASACLSDFLREAREPFDHEARGPRVAVATLPGEAHEGGLLMASLVIAMRGLRVVYLGADTPVEQIAAAVRSGGIEAVAISVSSASSGVRTSRSVARLRGVLPRRIPLWVGGAGAPVRVKGVEGFATLEAFDAWLAAEF